MTTDPRVVELRSQIEALPRCPEELALLKELLALAQELGDEELEYQTRGALIPSANFLGDTDTFLSSFAWCLAQHDADPQRFPAKTGWSYGADLMWCYKWVIGSLAASPVFSREQVEAALADMTDHYRQAGLGQGGLLVARFSAAWRLGDMQKVESLRRALITTPRDDYSDCEACTRGTLIECALHLHDDQEAFRLLDEMLDQRLRCEEQPASAMGSVLVAKLRAGEFDQAREYHLSSYRMIRHEPEMLGTMADNLEFCAITGNEARGLTLLERHLAWLGHDALAANTQFSFLCAVALVLESVSRAGYGDQAVRGAESPRLARFFGEQPRDAAGTPRSWSVAELAVASWSAAGRVAEAFDRRNGNGYYSSVLTEKRALLDERYDLPIAVPVYSPPTVTPAAPRTAADWLNRGGMLSEAGLHDDALAAYRQAIVLGVAGDDLVRATSNIVAELVAQGEFDQAVAALPAAVAAKRTDGRDGQAALEAKLGLLLYRAETAEDAAALEAELASGEWSGEALTPLEQVLASCRFRLIAATQDPAASFAPVEELITSILSRTTVRRTAENARLNWANLRAIDDEPAAALDIVDALLAEDVSPTNRFRGLMSRSRYLGQLNRFAEAAAAADEATAWALTQGVPQLAVTAANLAGECLIDDGNHAEAANRFGFALSEANRLEMPGTWLAVQQGRALCRAGLFDAAVEVLDDTLHRLSHDQDSTDEQRGDVMHWLGLALRDAGDPNAAASMFARSAEALERAGNSEASADQWWLRGLLYASYRMPDCAVEDYDRAWEVFGADEPDEHGLRLDILLSRAMAKSTMQDPAALDDIDLALAFAQRSGEPRWLAVVTDRRGQVLGNLERGEEAAAAFLQAADLFAPFDLVSAARSEHCAAAELNGLDGRRAEAIPLWRQALDHAEAALADGGDAELRNFIALRLGDALEAQGDVAAAAEARAHADPQ